MGPGTQATSNPAGGEMSTFSDYNRIMQGDQALYSGIAKGFNTIGSSIAASGSQNPSSVISPMNTPILDFPQIAPYAPIPQNNAMIEAIQRILGG